MAEVNAQIADGARTRGDVEVVDVATAMLGDDGTPRPELFADDGLHLNETGYELWRSILGPHLAAPCAGATPPPP